MTLGALWASLLGPHDVGDVLAWPPDAFALVDRALDASEAYRFVVSPPPGARLEGIAEDEARDEAREWWRWLDGDRPGPPPRLACWWTLIQEAAGVEVDGLSCGREWPLVEALLAVHAVADEACAGLGVAATAPPGPGCRFRAAARELLAETRSLSRISPGIVRILPRCRAGLAGITIHSLSRHVFVSGPQVDVDWHRMLAQPTGVDLPEGHANVLLLPWPLRVRARDFRPARYSLPHMDLSRFGFFEYEPDRRLDLQRVDAVLRSAEDEAGTVDVVMLPEAALLPEEVEPLEALLGEHGAWSLIAGVRSPPGEGEGLGANFVHFSVRQELVWRHARQHKHHRWCLDGRQIAQYQLGGALTSSRRWWEAVDVPPRSLQIIDEGGVTVAPLVCEDLARLEPVAELVRAIGPSLVVTLLLDGPQLASRWTARYASVLADDPGTAVLTLTAYGMVQRCRPPGCEPSQVVALWKDASGQTTEIELEAGADAVLIATAVEFGDSATADGRGHPGSTAEFSLVGVQPVRAAEPGRGPRAPWGPEGLPVLDEHEVTKATSWCEAAVEAVLAGPGQAELLLAHALATDWRAELGLPPPTRLFVRSLEAVRDLLPVGSGLDDLVTAIDRLATSEDPAAVVTADLLRMALAQRLVAEVRAGRRPPEALGPAGG